MRGKGGQGPDTDSEDYLNEKVLIMVGNPANELVIAEDQIALHCCGNTTWKR